MATYEELLAQSLGSGSHLLTSKRRPVQYRTIPRHRKQQLNYNIPWFCVPCCMIFDVLAILGGRLLEFGKRCVRWIKGDIDEYDELLSAL